MPTTTVEQVLILTPDKDLGQCVRGRRVVQFDRRKRELIDHDGVVAKFGVEPASIPDYLGLVGDSSDGFPGLPGWGARSAASVLARYGHLEEIPAAAGQWDVAGLRGAAKLAATLQDNFELAAAVPPPRHARHRHRRRHRRLVAVDGPDRRVPGDGRAVAGTRARRRAVAVAPASNASPDDGDLGRNYGWQ